MSSKKVHQSQPDGHENARKPLGAAGRLPVRNAAQEIPSDHNDLAELEKQLAEAQSQAAEYKDGWQRSVAEFQNYRRRVEAERAETYQSAVGGIIKRYLPVLDDMERAIGSRPAGLAWADGVELICRKLQSILEAEGP